MSECEDLTGDELAECQENRARRKQFVDRIGHRLVVWSLLRSISSPFSSTCRKTVSKSRPVRRPSLARSRTSGRTDDLYRHPRPIPGRLALSSCRS